MLIPASPPRPGLLLTGATGFVGSAAFEPLRDAGWDVRCATRNTRRAAELWPDRAWTYLDVDHEDSILRAMEGCEAAVYMVHGMASQSSDFHAAELRQAENFARAAAKAGLRRIVYLGGVAPSGDASRHLQSRQEVGEVLRAGSVPTIELRASMIVGHGSLSWLMVRDLAARLPVMVLPRWLKSRTQPVALEDVLVALTRALVIPLEGSAWFDIPGPETLSGRQILERTARALGVRQPVMIEVPFLSPRLSSHWVRFVTRAEWSVAREVVVGLKQDLIAQDNRFWRLAGHEHLCSFDDAARRALRAEAALGQSHGLWGLVERARMRSVPA